MIMRKLKDVVGILGIGCLTWVCLHTNSIASTGKVTTETVKLRSKPSTSSSIVQLLSLNDKVEVVEKSGEWYKVSADGKTGYVHQNYLKVDDKNSSDKKNSTSNTTSNNTEKNNTTSNNTTSVETNSVENISTDENSVTNNEKTEDTNNIDTTTEGAETEKQESTIGETGEKELQSETKVYILPLINVSSIGNIEKGKKVNVTENINGWSYITSDTISGWVRSDKLVEIKNENNNPKVETKVEETTNKESNENSNTEKNTNETTKKEETKKEEKANASSKVGYVSVGTANLRKETNTSSQVVANLSLNDKVEILGEENNWYKVKVNGKQGYIAKSLISNKKQTSNTSRGEEVDRENNTPNSNANTAVVSYAKNLIGSRYVSGGSTPNGFDCSGFTYYVYKNFGVSLSRASSGQANNGKAVDKSNLVEGDLVLFSQGSKKIGHVGIYIGNNQFIHAANARKGVIITSLSDSYYTKNYVTARRVLDN